MKSLKIGFLAVKYNGNTLILSGLVVRDEVYIRRSKTGCYRYKDNSSLKFLLQVRAINKPETALRYIATMKIKIVR